MTLEILPQKFTVCQVRRIPPQLLETAMCFIGRTDHELSLVCPTEYVPAQPLAREDGWRGFRIEGTLEFSLVGILSHISGILASEGIGIFAISTYDTDYILLKEQALEQAVKVLQRDGYSIQNMAVDG